MTARRWVIVVAVLVVLFALLHGAPYCARIWFSEGERPMSTSDPAFNGPAYKSRADELSDTLRLVRDALSLDLGDGIDTVTGARQVREERDRLAWRVRELEAASAAPPEDATGWLIERHVGSVLIYWTGRKVGAPASPAPTTGGER